MDMNDRALHGIVVGLGGRTRGVPRESGFDITPASEVMAILCLARDLQDLKERCGRIAVADRGRGAYVTAAELEAQGAMAALLRDAVQPNLVQNLEGGPALIHGGPFGNIAHGCNTLIATRLALKLADLVVTEAGFGADLGAEKFFNIKCPAGGLRPKAGGAGGHGARAEDARRRWSPRPQGRKPGGAARGPAKSGGARGQHPQIRRAAGGGRQPLSHRYGRGGGRGDGGGRGHGGAGRSFKWILRRAAPAPRSWR